MAVFLGRDTLAGGRKKGRQTHHFDPYRAKDMNATTPTPDGQTAAILDKARAGTRLTPDEALILAVAAPLHDLCEAALAARVVRHGKNAYYVRNIHINFTNVCVNACRFCAFSKVKGEPGAHTASVADIVAELAAHRDAVIREIHVVGGLNPELPLDYYLDMLRAIARERPAPASRPSPPWKWPIWPMSRACPSSQSWPPSRRPACSCCLAAEPRCFHRTCANACAGEDFGRPLAPGPRHRPPPGPANQRHHAFRPHRDLGRPGAHLSALRDLQDMTGGFTCFIPLAYQPANNYLGASGPDGLTVLRLMALSRLFLDNIPHLKAYWAMLGIKAAQMALWAGADDFDGTIIEERIGHAAGADSPKGLTLGALRRAIEAAGLVPVERTADFRPVTQA
jgi:aminodeoxyfutalosine synthase